MFIYQQMNRAVDILQKVRFSEEDDKFYNEEFLNAVKNNYCFDCRGNVHNGLTCDQYNLKDITGKLYSSQEAFSIIRKAENMNIARSNLQKIIWEIELLSRNTYRLT
jgi:hypothetical protein